MGFYDSRYSTNCHTTSSTSRQKHIVTPVPVPLAQDPSNDIPRTSTSTGNAPPTNLAPAPELISLTSNANAWLAPPVDPNSLAPSSSQANDAALVNPADNPSSVNPIPAQVAPPISSDVAESPTDAAPASATQTSNMRPLSPNVESPIPTTKDSTPPANGGLGAVASPTISAGMPFRSLKTLAAVAVHASMSNMGTGDKENEQIGTKIRKGKKLTVLENSMTARYNSWISDGNYIGLQIWLQEHLRAKLVARPSKRAHGNIQGILEQPWCRGKSS